MGMEYDRFMVASWGRAGSVALAEVLEQDLRARSPDGRVTWYNPGPHEVIPSRQWSIYHGNSLEQLAEIDHMGIVVALRQPASSALSSCLMTRQGYTHVHTDEQVRLANHRLGISDWASKHGYYARVVRDSWARRDLDLVTVPMEELRYRRLVCMNWNDIAARLLAGRARPMVFDQWHGDVALAASMMGVGTPELVTVVQDPRPMIDRVTNAEEVAGWLATCADEDASMLAAWQQALSP